MTYNLLYNGTIVGKQVRCHIRVALLRMFVVQGFHLSCVELSVSYSPNP